jgi:hypothetical protein
LNEDWAGKPAYSEANNIKSREVETMTRKITKSGSNSRSRLLTTVSAVRRGYRIAVSHQLLQKRV